MTRIRVHDPRSGMILVTVLWTIALLSALAMAASTTFRGFAGIIVVDRDKARADALLRAGLEVSAGIVAKLGDQNPLTEREASVSLATGTVRMWLIDENGRIDVNRAPVKVLAALLRYAGAADDSEPIAQSIEDWRKQDQPDQPPGASKLPNNAPNAPPPPQGLATAAPKKSSSFQSFTDLRQLANIQGVTPEILAAITPFSTVFGGEQVNAMSAPPEVLAALPGMSPGALASFLGLRDRSPTGGDRLLQMLGPAKQYVTTQGAPVASVELIAQLVDGYKAAAKAVVVVVPDDKQPYRVLAWTPVQLSARHPAFVADRSEENP